MQLCTVERVWRNDSRWFLLLNIPPLNEPVLERVIAALGETVDTRQCKAHQNNRLEVELDANRIESSEHAQRTGEALCSFASTMISTYMQG